MKKKNIEIETDTITNEELYNSEDRARKVETITENIISALLALIMTGGIITLITEYSQVYKTITLGTQIIYITTTYILINTTFKMIEKIRRTW